MSKYNVKKITTTDGVRYIIFRGNKVSLSERTYYKKKLNAIKRVRMLNKRIKM